MTGTNVTVHVCVTEKLRVRTNNNATQGHQSSFEKHVGCIEFEKEVFNKQLDREA